MAQGLERHWFSHPVSHSNASPPCLRHWIWGSSAQCRLAVYIGCIATEDSDSREIQVQSTIYMPKSKPKPLRDLILKVGSFNVRGLAKKSKREQLGRDLANFGGNLFALQETRVPAFTESTPCGARIYNLGGERGHGGGSDSLSPENSFHFLRVSPRE